MPIHKTGFVVSLSKLPTQEVEGPSFSYQRHYKRHRDQQEELGADSVSFDYNTLRYQVHTHLDVMYGKGEVIHYLCTYFANAFLHIFCFSSS